MQNSGESEHMIFISIFSILEFHFIQDKELTIDGLYFLRLALLFHI